MRHFSDPDTQRAYHAWTNMRTRCNNPNYRDWHLYGGRGIAVCERWAMFDAFLVDMGPCKEGLTIERIDNEGHYEPTNCSWATRREQALNRRRTVWVEHAGTRLCVKDWAAKLGIEHTTFRNRAKARGGDYLAAIREALQTIEE